jgi:hypothetical protein
MNNKSMKKIVIIAASFVIFGVGIYYLNASASSNKQNSSQAISQGNSAKQLQNKNAPATVQNKSMKKTRSS